MAGAVALTLLLAPASAVAQQSGQERSALARSLFEEGVELGREGRWEEAADRYWRVLELVTTPQVQYNLAHALSQLGRVVEPSELCRQILRDPNAPPAARADAERLLAELEPRIGRLTIQLEGSPEGAEVRIDDELVLSSAIGVAAPIDPGTHQVTAVRGGETLVSREVEVPEGGQAEVTLDVPPPPVPDPAEAAAAAEPGSGAASGERTAPGATPAEGGGGWWIWAAVGGVAVAAGVIAAVLLLGGGDEPLDGNLMPGRIEFE